MLAALYATMPHLAALFIFLFGTIIGSFLNVYIYRFHTKRSLGGSSHCLSCGVPLRAYDLIPVVSYLWLRGRCRSCGCRFSGRYVLVEVATGLLFVAALFRVGVGIDLWLLLILLSTYVIIFVYDVRHYIIPDMLTAFVLLITLLLTAPRSLAADPWLSYGIDVLAAMLGALFLFSLWFVSKGTWLGFGDVKLAVPLGLLVGASLVFSFIVVSFWVGAALSLVLIGAARLTRGQLRLPFLPRGLTIKSVVPFAPFLISGALIVYFTAFDVLTIFTF